ncbi:MAG: leucine-rich repeat domain-containing protein, partial [Ruminiclostridium sp.]|nr:leucine-rich repeat domain-containing protein [Ruminiclostridium sp.]
MKTGIFKRIVSAFLAGVMAFTTLTSSISAETAQQGDGLNFDYSVEGDNSLAGMFADVLSEEGVTDPAEGYNGYIVNRVTMADNVATVEYSVIEDSTIIVSLYDEQGYEMLATASAEVSKDNNKATITFAASEVPEYYLVKAYVVDENMRPKCKEYITNDYTEAFVEMMSKTVEDFPEEQVLNLDESTTNNFMVYNEDVVQVPYVAEKNIVVSADFEKQVFVFDNIDESISNLNPGETFSYVYGSEDIIITEIVSVEISGTTATIYGKEVDMKEVFDFIKIDSTITDGEVVEGTEGEGVTYIESESTEKDAANELSQTEQRKNGDDPDVEVFIGKTFTFDLKEKTMQGDSTVDGGTIGDESEDNSGDGFEAGFTGQLELQLGGFMRIYFDGGLFTPTYKAEFVLEYDMTLTLGVEAKFQHTWELPDIMLFSIYGVNIVINPELVLEMSGKIAIVAEFTSAKRGFSIENNGNGIITREINEEPELDFDLKIEVEIKVTLHLGLAVELIDESILNIELAVHLSVVITAEAGLLYSPDNTAPEQHDCSYKGFLCVDGGIDFEISLVFEFSLCDWDWTRIKYEPQNPFFKIHLADFYYSDAYKEFGWGECPYISYRTTIRLKNGINSKIGSAKVYFGEEDTEGIEADNLNIATSYLLPLPEGEKHTIKATAPGYIDLEEEIEVSAETGAAIHEFKMKREPSDVTIKTVKADGTPAAGANVFIGDRNWGYTDENGELLIEKTLSLYEEYTFSVHNDAYEYYMEPEDILLEKSTVTLTVGIAETDFYYTIENKEVTITWYNGEKANVVIPSKIEGYPVTAIGEGALVANDFTSVKIPDSVKSIGNAAFTNCSNLASVNIPNGVKTIGTATFSGCESLTDIIIPNSVTRIGEYAFSNCTALRNAIIPDSVASIGELAFHNCNNLTSVIIPDGVTSISESTFSECDNLASIIIGNNVTSIGKHAFLNCVSLTSITIPNNVTTIDDYAFFGCTNLSSVIFGSGITSIGHAAFNNCSKLTDVYYAGTEEQWSSIVIGDGNYKLNDATIHYNYTPATVDISYNSHDTMTAETVEVAYLNDTATTETIDVSRAVFTGLIPEKLYNFYVMVDKDAEAPFSAANLLNIQQGTADSTGALTITYIGDERFDTADIFVVCEDPISIENAMVSEISFEYTGKMQYVDPVVTLDGKVLDSTTD